jgi:hypothetical protein
MRTKVQWASAIALAATVLTALFSVQGSGAAASEMDPIIAKQESAVENAAVKFVSEPVVQTLSAEEGEGAVTDSDMATTPDFSEASSLSQLVSEQALPQSLGKQMQCLAGAVYFESRGESLEGQLAVARVIINRAASDRFPDSYCDVVFQRSQFSFVRGGAMPSIRKNSRGWHRAVAIARIAEEGMWQSPARGALFFHATRVSPNWRLTRVGRIDNHIFYR